MLDCLLDHKAHEHFFEVIDAPTLQLYIELLMRNIEKICQLLGIVKPEQMRKGSRHEDLKGDTVALAKLVMKEGEKPGKFLLPHGIILLGWWLRIFMEDNPYGIQNQSSFRIMELSGIFALSWCIATVVSTLGGIILGSVRGGVDFSLADLGLKVFPVVILGGLDSVAGAIVGGVLIGVLENLSGGYLDPIMGGGVKEVAPFVALVIILMLRPYGLFGKVEIERV